MGGLPSNDKARESGSEAPVVVVSVPDFAGRFVTYPYG